MLASAAGLLALGGALAGGATIAAAAPVADDPDAALLALCDEYTALDRAFCANSDQSADLLASSPEFEALHEAGCAMVPRLHELEDLIAATRPRTGRGRLAKMEAARRSMLSDADDPDCDLLGDRDAELPFAAIEEAIEDLLARLGREA